jgi:hypothetical protein
MNIKLKAFLHLLIIPLGILVSCIFQNFWFFIGSYILFAELPLRDNKSKG